MGFGGNKISTLKIVRNKKFWKDVDLIIWIVPFILVHLSCFLIASTQRNIGIADWYHHAIIAYIGSLIVYFLAQVPLQDLRKYIVPIYVFTILTLLYVNFSGTSALGAQRWLSFAGVYVQPSEFAKLTLILVLASILDRRRFTNLSHVIKPLLVSIFPWILVFIQPDLGTSLVFGAILLGMLYWSGMPYEWAFIILATFVTGLLAYLYQFGLFIWIPIIGFLSYKSLSNQKQILTILVVLFHLFIAKIICLMPNHNFAPKGRPAGLQPRGRPRRRRERRRRDQYHRVPKEQLPQRAPADRRRPRQRKADDERGEEEDDAPGVLLEWAWQAHHNEL